MWREGKLGQTLANLAMFLAIGYRTNLGTNQLGTRPFWSFAAGSQGVPRDPSRVVSCMHYTCC